MALLQKERWEQKERKKVPQGFSVVPASGLFIIIYPHNMKHMHISAVLATDITGHMTSVGQ